MRKVHRWLLAALALIGLTLVFGCSSPDGEEDTSASRFIASVMSR